MMRVESRVQVTGSGGVTTIDGIAGGLSLQEVRKKTPIRHVRSLCKFGKDNK
jgi:hypothetical protein